MRNSSSKQVKVSSSNHLVISSIDVNYSKLVEEDQKRIDELKEKIVNQKLLLDKNKKELNEIKENNDKMKDNIYQKNKELDKIKKEKKNYENLNNNITRKIEEITHTIEEQRQRQIHLLQRREVVMNYLMSMLMGLRQREENYPNVDNMSYEELLALEERMGNVSKGLNKEQIDKLPKEKFIKNKFIDDKCIICQYEFKNPDTRTDADDSTDGDFVFHCHGYRGTDRYGTVCAYSDPFADHPLLYLGVSRNTTAGAAVYCILRSSPGWDSDRSFPCGCDRLFIK